MRPPSLSTPFPFVDSAGLYRLEVEQHVTKEVAFHIVRDPRGRPVHYAKTVSDAIDWLVDAGHEACVLVADEWVTVLYFDLAGALVSATEAPDRG